MTLLTDTQNFIDTVRSRHDFFRPNEEIIVTRAPGRLDVMGGVADYSGSLVLQLPIADATHVAIQKRSSTKLTILSLGNNTDDRFIEIELSEFLANGSPIEYADARARFSAPENHWAAYVTGVFLVLMRERNVRFDHGARILIKSNVPEGKGVSSSAAIEVAVMKAVTSAFNITVGPEEVATLCQILENLIAGAPCGIMDQMTSACGKENELLELLCQPDRLQGTLALPDELNVWGIDSGVRHSVSGSDYGTVRTAAFMGYRMIAEIAGLKVSSSDDGRVSINDPKWHGYLANISPDEFEKNYLTRLPETMNGSDFLNKYQGTTDSVTRVKPETAYPVRKATQHPIYENARVHSFAAMLKNWHGLGEAAKLGALMFGSHQSYSDCGLGSEATDLIVDLVREASTDGLYGARITGGGSGGTVAVLGHRDAIDAIERVRQNYYAKTGYLPVLIAGSSPGAVTFDYLRLENIQRNTV
ncbi:MAG TPA: galactokinase family protein [Pyrinomonadaceae bacterium]